MPSLRGSARSAAPGLSRQTLHPPKLPGLVAERIAALPAGSQPPLIGINGAQGSGKSTLAQMVAIALGHFHALRPALLSLDDFYLGKPPRHQLRR